MSTRWTQLYISCSAKWTHTLHVLQSGPLFPALDEEDPYATSSPLWIFITLEVHLSHREASPLEVRFSLLKAVACPAHFVL